MKHAKLGGVIPALVTPFDSNDRLDESGLEKLVSYHLRKGVDGFYLCGTTGQGIYMSPGERKRVAEITVSIVGKTVPVIVHIGCTAPGEARELAAHAAATGADAISSIIPPTYTAIESVAAYFRMLCDAAPQLPLLPYFMGSPLPPLQIMKAISGVPSVAGTKYTGPNMHEMTQIIEMRGKEWTVFSGMDEQCVFAAMCGADGAIGSSINVIPGVYKKIRALVAQDKTREAYALQLRGNRIITTLLGYGYAAALKAALGFLGMNCGAPRLPELPLAPGQAEKLKADLDAAGFQELAGM